MRILWKIADSASDIQLSFFDTNRRKYENCSLSDLKDSSDIYGLIVEDGDILCYDGYSQLPYATKELWTLLGFDTQERKYVFRSTQSIAHSIPEHSIAEFDFTDVVNATLRCGKVCMLDGPVPKIREQENGTLEFTNNTVSKLLSFSGSATSGGIAEKFLGVRTSDGKIGILKRRFGDNTFDSINEVICWKLGKLFGVEVCEASFEYFKGEELVMSIYDVLQPEFVSCKTAFSKPGKEFYKTFNKKEIESRFGERAFIDFKRMIIFDLLTRQEDRHINNFGFVSDGMYPLYDNGRSLFWNISDLEEIMNIGLADSFVSNEHGYDWCYVMDSMSLEERRSLINQNVTQEDIFGILHEYYEQDRASVISRYIYSVYKFIFNKH